jgi:hypothetical protein
MFELSDALAVRMSLLRILRRGKTIMQPTAILCGLLTCNNTALACQPARDFSMDCFLLSNEKVCCSTLAENRSLRSHMFLRHMFRVKHLNVAQDIASLSFFTMWHLPIFSDCPNHHGHVVHVAPSWTAATAMISVLDGVCQEKASLNFRSSPHYPPLTNSPQARYLDVH